MPIIPIFAYWDNGAHVLLDVGCDDDYAGLLAQFGNPTSGRTAGYCDLPNACVVPLDDPSIAFRNWLDVRHTVVRQLHLLEHATFAAPKLWSHYKDVKRQHQEDCLLPSDDVTALVVVKDNLAKLEALRQLMLVEPMQSKLLALKFEEENAPILESLGRGEKPLKAIPLIPAVVAAIVSGAVCCVLPMQYKPITLIPSAIAGFVLAVAFVNRHKRQA